MKKLLPFIFCFISFSIFAQDVNLTGLWIGTITQDEGGYRPEYTFEIYLNQDGEAVTGRSYVFVDKIYAVMNLRGSLHSKLYLNLKDEKILDHKVDNGMEWCMKKYQLVLKNKDGVFHLEGFWQGDTTFSTCIPGKVRLTKTEPRA